MSTWPTSTARRVTLVENPIISHEREEEGVKFEYDEQNIDDQLWHIYSVTVNPAMMVTVNCRSDDVNWEPFDQFLPR